MRLFLMIELNWLPNGWTGGLDGDMQGSFSRCLPLLFRMKRRVGELDFCLRGTHILQYSVNTLHEAIGSSLAAERRQRSAHW